MSLIDVLLPVKNGAHTLRSAIVSVLSQSLSDFRLIVIDDGSMDDTPNIVDYYARRDDRILHVSNPQIGIVAALNHGLSISSAPYLARMDADDISLPERFEKQIEAFKHNPNLVLLGTSIFLFGKRVGLWPPPVGSDVCRTAFSLFTPLSHPSIMMRRQSLDCLTYAYDPSFQLAEDYELFSRLSQYGEVNNLVEPLLLYRTSNNSLTSRNLELMRRLRFEVARRHIGRLHGIDTPSYMLTLASMLRAAVALGPSFARRSLSPLKFAIKYLLETNGETVLSATSKDHH